MNVAIAMVDRLPFFKSLWSAFDQDGRKRVSVGASAALLTYCTDIRIDSWNCRPAGNHGGDHSSPAQNTVQGLDLDSALTADPADQNNCGSAKEAPWYLMFPMRVLLVFISGAIRDHGIGPMTTYWVEGLPGQG